MGKCFMDSLGQALCRIVYGILISSIRLSFFRCEMSRTRVTSKFQLTIPKDIREQVDLRPGEVVEVKVDDGGVIIIKRFRRVKDPLKALIGKTTFPRHVSIEELEEKAETR